MGNKNSQLSKELRLSKDEINTWKGKYHLSDDKFVSFMNAFKKHKDPTNTISKKNFIQMLKEVGVDSNLAELMFKGADLDNSGSIDLNEFLMIHGISEGGSIEEKLEASFRIFDADGSGTLSADEVEHMFQLAVKTNLQIQANNAGENAPVVILDEDLKNEIKAIVKEIFEKVDTDGNNTLSLDEFKAGFTNHQDICSFFNQL